MSKFVLSTKHDTYPEMADSGVDWIGKIPKGWNMVPLKKLFYEPVKEVVGSRSKDYTLLSLTKGGVVPRVSSAGKHPANLESYQIFYSGELVFCQFDYDVTPRTIGRVREDGILTGAYTRLKDKSDVSTRYYFYHFLFLDDRKELLHRCTGLRNGLASHNFWTLPAQEPSYEDQQKIADFLDERTARIDAIIEKKKELIELLKEKRASLIHHAVTKGLDPEVELVDSGVEWIGKIPKGWRIDRIKYISKINYDTLSDTSTPKDYEFRYVDIGNVTTGCLVVDPVLMQAGTAPSRAKRHINNGDIILSTVRTYLKAIYFFPEVQGQMVASTGFAQIAPCADVFAQYIYYAMLAENFIQKIEANSNGVSYPAINAWQIGDMYLQLPTFANQQKIATYLNECTVQINAVTGKIKI